MHCFSVLHSKHVWVAQMLLSVFQKVLWCSYVSIYALHKTNQSFSPECSHRCLESSQKTEAPRRCWSRYRSDLWTARSAGSQGGEHYWLDFTLWAFTNTYISICVSPLHTHEPVCARVCTLPFSGRTIDWDWQSSCLASYSELEDWPSALLSVIVLRVSEEAARCMLFTGVKGFASVVERWQTGGRDSPDLLTEN